MGKTHGRQPSAFTMNPRRAVARRAVRLGALAALLAATAWTPAAQAQQQDFIVDVSDPNVQVDLSVLDDGGLTPRMNAPVPPATTAAQPGTQGYRPPGTKTPVSTLYIQPSGPVNLPPQSKSLIARTPTAPAEPTMDEVPMDEAPMDEAQTAAAPPAPEPAPEPAPAAEPAEPTAAGDDETAVTPPPPAPEIDTPEPVSTPEEIAAAEPEPAPAPEPEPEPEPQPKAEAEAEAVPAPPPPPPADETPTALTSDAQPAPAAESEAETAQAEPAQTETAQTETAQAETAQAEPAQAPAPAPAPSPSGSVTMDLPPADDTARSGVASLPPADNALASGDGMRIVFEHDSSRLPDDARDALLQLADQLGQDDAMRLQLLAYAGDADTSASAARRLSLSRALAVRSFLIENGVRSTRIDVRALGNKSADEVTERVDITVVER